MIKEDLKNLIEKAIKKLYPDFHDRENQGIDVLVEVPKEKSHGDYSTSIALSLSKKLEKNPMEIANEITVEINHSLIRTNERMIEKIEVATPGFINFYLSKEMFTNNLKEILKNPSATLWANKNLKNQKVIIEYTDPNILKDFHIGHLMSNTIGEALSRIFEFQGTKVKRVNYQGDVGLHVAKAIWGRLKDSNLTWQDSYALGSKQYEEDELAKAEIVVLNKKVFEKSDKAINKLYDQGRKESLAYFEKNLQKTWHKI